MQVVVRNPQWARKELWQFAVPETVEYQGEVVHLKHVGKDAIALSTGLADWPVRVIPRSWIISINGQAYTHTDTNQTKTVKGSKGEIYTVTMGARPSCTCTGFQFRKSCKHIL